MANPEHLAILKQGVGVWNQGREENPDIRPDLSDADLHGADLAQAHLRYSDLTGANLIKANLGGATLVCCDLTLPPPSLHPAPPAATPW